MINIDAGFAKHNPDVLTCIANLSSDEVFTPPSLATEMLDLVALQWAEQNDGHDIWGQPDVKFLDPFTKSGVFLREIVKRLNEGLSNKIPDLQKRIDHILTKQVYGIGITNLTSLISRRTVYCSKDAAGEHSITKAFNSSEGNIWFERTEHSWETRSGGQSRCRFCGASEAEYLRKPDLETHAYAFIHTEDISNRLEEMFGDKMKFDVVIGNPPYQLGSDGGTRDVPIYQKFVLQAQSLDPQFICMVIPARWMATGLGLTGFREHMLNDKQISHLVDYPVAKEVFPSVEIKGGVCYFLWRRGHQGPAEITNIRDGVSIGPSRRELNEYDIFVRESPSVEILRKVQEKNEESINSILSVDKEFGWTSNFDGFHDTEGLGDIPLHYAVRGRRKIGFIQRAEITKSSHLIDKWKVMVPQAGSDGGQRLPDYVLGKPHVAGSPSVCTQTFLFFWTDSEMEARSLMSYLKTRFFRFLVSLRKITQHATRSTYLWVPMQSWDREWTDEELFLKYNLSPSQVEFIESRVRGWEEIDA